MKKLIATAALAMVGLSSFAQGNVLLVTPVRTTWDNFSSTNSKLAADMYLTLLFSTSIPSIENISNSGSGTNAATGLSSAGNSSTYFATNSLNNGNGSFSVATAWSYILNGNSFIVQDNGTNIYTSVAANGAVSFNSNNAFQANNVNAGTTYYAYLLAWSNAYATPALAAAANGAVGWSAYFSYTPTSGVTTPVNINTLSTPFGVVITAVPEPSTMALAALGGVSLLLFRRRQSK